MTEKIKGSWYTKLKNSTMLAGSQGPEMREQEKGAESPYVRVQMGKTMRTVRRRSGLSGPGALKRDWLRGTGTGGSRREGDVN